MRGLSRLATGMPQSAEPGLSAWAAQRQSGRGTRPQYSQFERPAFAPPGAAFPVVWSALNQRHGRRDQQPLRPPLSDRHA
jgi:hypothetical protein